MTKEMNHTKGEWTAYEPEGSNGYWYVGGSDIVCYGNSAKEDAQLIASAPLLYEALKEIKTWISDEENVRLQGKGFAEYFGIAKTFEKADKALAKAEGK